MMATHEQNRLKVCLLCFKKKSNLRVISEKFAKVIRNHSLPYYDRHDEKYPKTMCHSCRIILTQHEKGEKNCNIKVLHDYSTDTTVKITRKTPKCECLLCRVVRDNISFNPYNNKKNKGRPKSVKKPPITKRCEKCLSKYWKRFQT